VSTRDVFGLGDRAVARTGDPETSHEAADSVPRERIRLTQERVLALLDDLGDQTDEDLAANWRWDLVSPSGLRTRRAEVTARGLVTWSGGKVRMRTGRMARVWTITAAGREARADLRRGRTGGR
jgi:hypothetical protein